MKKVIVGLIAILLLVSISCSPAPSPAPALAPAPAPAPMPRPTPTPVPMPTPVLTNSESDSRVAELEAKIRQLEFENQRLVTENRQLSSDLTAMTTKIRQLESESQRLKTENQELNSELVKVTVVVQNLQSLVNSSSYTNTIGALNDVQAKANELAYFAEGLPDLPPLPPGLTVSEINQAINKALTVRRVIRDLPSLPPPGWPFFIPFPPELLELERQRQIFLEVTEFMENLHDLPEFLATAGSLEDLRSRIEGYLGDVQNTAPDAGGILEQVRDVASP